jgi:hypothetical protein
MHQESLTSYFLGKRITHFSNDFEELKDCVLDGIEIEVVQSQGRIPKQSILRVALRLLASSRKPHVSHSFGFRPVIRRRVDIGAK